MDIYAELTHRVINNLHVLAELAKVIDTYDTEEIMEASSACGILMTALVDFVNQNEGLIAENVEALIKSASFALVAANEEDGTVEMVDVAVKALTIVRGILS